MRLSLVIVDDLNVDRASRTFRPLETDTPLVVDPNAVLALPISTQSLETVAGQGAQVLQ
jgi:hypothetical protein